ncbi:MAG: hypothetical protein LBN02_03140 [Oscillospiraceae bacterium]|jgi:hypothetical protein|nr:hypothetical protein [Oscillospiraceae bacterium]
MSEFFKAIIVEVVAAAIIAFVAYLWGRGVDKEIKDANRHLLSMEAQGIYRGDSRLNNEIADLKNLWKRKVFLFVLRRILFWIPLAALTLYFLHVHIDHVLTNARGITPELLGLQNLLRFMLLSTSSWVKYVALCLSFLLMILYSCTHAEKYKSLHFYAYLVMYLAPLLVAFLAMLLSFSSGLIVVAYWYIIAFFIEFGASSIAFCKSANEDNYSEYAGTRILLTLTSVTVFLVLVILFAPLVINSFDALAWLLRA